MYQTLVLFGSVILPCNLITAQSNPVKDCFMRYVIRSRGIAYQAYSNSIPLPFDRKQITPLLTTEGALATTLSILPSAMRVPSFAGQNSSSLEFLIPFFPFCSSKQNSFSPNPRLVLLFHWDSFIFKIEIHGCSVWKDWTGGEEDARTPPFNFVCPAAILLASEALLSIVPSGSFFFLYLGTKQRM